MKTTITKADLDSAGIYRHSESLIIAGDLLIEADLGTVRFRRSVSVTVRIQAMAGTGIEVGQGIDAGGDITEGGKKL